MQARTDARGERSQGMRYYRLMPLGSGGMANVHLSLAVGQSGFKRLVVVKSMRQELLSDAATRQLFLAEARLSARLNHPNVVQVSEVLETSDGVMLVMEYLDGLPLSAAYRSAGEAFSLPMRIRVLCDVLSGLGHAHDLTDYHGKPLGIVHRDVSPQNIFLTFDGRVKLLDFGIAKVNAAPDRTRTGVIKGRIAYMPVEQITGTTVDRRTDVYAVGCLLWEAIAGTRMWDKHSEAQILKDVLNGQVPRLGSRVRVDPELERIVHRAVAHSPSDRHASAEELRLELERYSSSLAPVSLRAVGELLSELSAEARAERRRELTEAVARAELELSSSEPTHAERVTIVDAVGAPQSTGISARATVVRSTRGLGPRSRPAPREDTSNSSTAIAKFRPRARGWLIAAGCASALAAAAWASTLLAPLPEAEPRSPPQTEAGGPPLADDNAATDPPTPTEDRDAPAEKLAAPEPPEPPAAEAEQRPQRSRARAGAPPRARTLPPGSSAPRAPENGCDPPYFFSAGIKTYKPECI